MQMEFDEAVWEECRDRSMLGDVRIRQLHSLLIEADSSTTPGAAVAEVGVLRGGTTRFMCRILPDRTVHAFDTFEGTPNDLVQSFEWWFLKRDTFMNTDVEEVMSYLGDCENARIHQGTFPESVDDLVESYCFCHIDCDLSRSVYDSIVYFHANLVPGGIILIDDYMRPECPGVAEAIHRFLSERDDLVLTEMEDFTAELRWK